MIWFIVSVPISVHTSAYDLYKYIVTLHNDVCTYLLGCSINYVRTVKDNACRPTWNVLRWQPLVLALHEPFLAAQSHTPVSVLHIELGSDSWLYFRENKKKALSLCFYVSSSNLIELESFRDFFEGAKKPIWLYIIEYHWIFEWQE